MAQQCGFIQGVELYTNEQYCEVEIIKQKKILDNQGAKSEGVCVIIEIKNETKS